MPPRAAAKTTAASDAAPRSKRAKTRSDAAQPSAAVGTTEVQPEAAGRASRAERQRNRAEVAAASVDAAAAAAREDASPSRSAGGEGEAAEQQPSPQQPPKKRLGRPPRSATAPAPAPAAADAPAPAPAAATSPDTPAAAGQAPLFNRRDFRFRTTAAASLQEIEAAARAAAAAAAAAAVATERTVAVASPALRPWFCSTPFRVAEFAKAGREALGEVDRVLAAASAGSRPSSSAAAAAAAASAAAPAPLAAAALLAEAEAAWAATAPASPPPPPQQARETPPSRQPQQELPPLVALGRAVALGPGGGRALVPGRDVLVTLSLSEAGRPERPLREVVLLATPGDGAEAGQTLQDARDAFRNACSADGAAEELGVGVQGAYCAVEGVLHTDNRTNSPSSAPSSNPSSSSAPPVVDYASPILEFLAATGILGPLPPREGEGSEARAAEVGRARRGRGRGRGAAAAKPAPSLAPQPPQPPPAPWRAGDLSTAYLSDLTLRLGGGSGYVFCHQGGCEHALAVRDVRLAGAADAPSPTAGAGDAGEEEDEEERHPPTTGDFPLLLFKARPPKARSCQACGSRRAAKATWRDAAAPSDPSFWCLRCYGDAHYGDDGTLLVPEHRVVEYRGG